jgi:uncharacterized protein
VIVYLDTSAFVKLIIDEPGASETRAWFSKARQAASSVVTYPEACAALCRRDRAEDPVEARLTTWRAELDHRWGRCAHVPVEEQAAGRLAVAHGLRGMDAVQLAAAVDLRAGVSEAAPATEVVFAAFDRRLLDAAKREGFATLGGPLE